MISNVFPSYFKLSGSDLAFSKKASCSSFEENSTKTDPLNGHLDDLLFFEVDSSFFAGSEVEVEVEASVELAPAASSAFGGYSEDTLDGSALRNLTELMLPNSAKYFSRSGWSCGVSLIGNPFCLRKGRKVFGNV